jgi:hypothetical protein
VKLNLSTAHIQRGLPVMALIGALLRLKWRREQQMKIWEKR